MKHYKLSGEDLLSLPTKKIGEQLIDYILSQKHYQSGQLSLNAIKKFYYLESKTTFLRSFSPFLKRLLPIRIRMAWHRNPGEFHKVWKVESIGLYLIYLQRDIGGESFSTPFDLLKQFNHRSDLKPP